MFAQLVLLVSIHSSFSTKSGFRIQFILLGKNMKVKKKENFCQWSVRMSHLDRMKQCRQITAARITAAWPDHCQIHFKLALKHILSFCNFFSVLYCKKNWDKRKKIRRAKLMRISRIFIVWPCLHYSLTLYRVRDWSIVTSRFREITMFLLSSLKSYWVHR